MELEEKRKAVVRDWFKLIIWYVRLRRCARGQFTPTKLLEVEERIQRQKLTNCVQKVKKARLENYEENLGSDGEASSEIEDPCKALYQEFNNARSD